MILLNGIEPTITRFPNGEISIKHDFGRDFEINRVIWTFNGLEDFVVLKLVEELIFDYHESSVVECTITYMPFSRMDRAHNGHPFSLRGVSEMLPVYWNYTVIEPHSQETVGLLESISEDDVKVINPSYDILKRELAKWEMFDMGINGLHKSVYIVFPDRGAYDRAVEYNVIEDLTAEFGGPMSDCVLIGEKARGWVGDIEGLVLTNLDGSDFEGDPDKITAFVVDDLVSYGGTFYRVVELLRDKEVKDVRLIATHIEDSIYKGELTTLGIPIHGTDSMGTTRKHPNVHLDALIDTYPEIFRNLPTEEVAKPYVEGEE